MKRTVAVFIVALLGVVVASATALALESSGPPSRPHHLDRAPLRFGAPAGAMRAAGILDASVLTQIVADVTTPTIVQIGDTPYAMGRLVNPGDVVGQCPIVLVTAYNGATELGSWWSFVPVHSVDTSGSGNNAVAYAVPVDIPVGVTTWVAEGYMSPNRYTTLSLFLRDVDSGTENPASPYGGMFAWTAVRNMNADTAWAPYLDVGSTWTDGVDTQWAETFGGFAYGSSIPSGDDATLTASSSTSVPLAAAAPPTISYTWGARREPTIQRLEGSNRYRTAARVSASTFTTSSDVVLVTGEDFPDALSASSLCGVFDAPLLLTTPASLNASAAAEIARLGATRVWIVGGTGAVSATARNQVLAIPGVTSAPRLAGTDRYDTARLVALQVRDEGSPFTASPFLARGDNFADALSVGPVAAASWTPILLTRPTSVPNATALARTQLGITNGVVVGGTGAVSNSVAQAVLGSDRIRLSGSTRYDTAAAVQEYGIASGSSLPNTMFVASGEAFPDGLAAGPAAAHTEGLLFLTLPTAAPDWALYDAWEFSPFMSRGRVVGGTGAVSSTAYNRWRGAWLGVYPF